MHLYGVSREPRPEGGKFSESQAVGGGLALGTLSYIGGWYAWECLRMDVVPTHRSMVHLQNLQKFPKTAPVPHAMFWLVCLSCGAFRHGLYDTGHTRISSAWQQRAGPSTGASRKTQDWGRAHWLLLTGHTAQC